MLGRDPSPDEKAMSAGRSRDRELLEKIRSLPAEQVAEVETFIDSCASARRSAGN